MEHAAASTIARRAIAEPSLGPIDLPPFPDGGRIAVEDRTSKSRPRFNEGLVVFLAALALYVIIAVFLDFRYLSIPGDAVSRLANGFYILYSRDPHLAAVGFVWEPLQSIVDMVLLLGNHIWPALAFNDMAGSLVSSIAMAGAAYQILAALHEWGVTRTPRLLLTACFAVNPMILLYAGNGMSEGLYLFTLLASTRYLLRWIRGGDLRSLAYAAVALAFSYLTRNEAAMAAVLGTMVVAVVSYWRAPGVRRSKIKTAMADCIIFAAPPFVAAAGWAITSYVITGEFFAQFQSIYGNSAQEQFLEHLSLHGRILYEVHSVEALGPLLPLVLLISAAVAAKRRDPRMLAPVAVLGGALAFDMMAYLDNTIENFFRYFIVAIPLEVMLVGSLVAAVQNTGSPLFGTQVAARLRSGTRALAVLVGVALILLVMTPATIATGAAMMNPSIGSEESQQLGFIFHSHLTAQDRLYKKNYPQVLKVDRYFESLHLPDGDVVVDNFAPCIPALIVTVNQPKLFVIPNDRDFQRILADPISFHTHYIFEADPAVFPQTATNIQYPKLWKTGAGFTKRVYQIPAAGTCPAFRLFHVLGHSNTVT